jgi:argininosuccinate lyase
MLHLLASASIYALSLSRFATDMLHWTTAEFNFLSLPDTLVGSSSAMPQKRNAFILEHVQGRSMSLLGAFVQAVSSMHSTSFTNSIAVGTEAVRPLWGALQDLTDITVLMRLMVGGARPVTEAMLRRCVEGFTTATAFADRLVAEHKTDFRTAHRLIGSAVLETLELNKENFPAAAESYVSIHGISASFDDLDPESVVKSLEYGGGPGPGSIQHHLTQLTEKWHSQNRQRKSYKQNWKDAALMLKRSIGQFIDTK